MYSVRSDRDLGQFPRSVHVDRARTKVRGPVGKSDHVKTTATVKVRYVSSIEELDTRSMSLSARPCDLLAPVGSHARVTIFSRESRRRWHFGARARIGLRSAERARFDTSSTMEHRSPIGVARRKRRRLAQVSQRTPRHRNRICSDLRRRYLSRSRVCSFSIAVWMGARRHVVSVRPSRPDAKRVKRSSTAGTCVQRL